MNHDASREGPHATPTVELVYDDSCPNVGHCRMALRAALVEAGLPPTWTEWDRNAADTPSEYRSYGSPTVLVDGRDVAESPADATPSGNSCRLYVSDATGCLVGAPSARSITRALGTSAPGPGAVGTRAIANEQLTTLPDTSRHRSARHPSVISK